MKKNPLILVSILFLLILIQFFRINKSNPPINSSIEFKSIIKISPERFTILKNACFDCHSNESIYPWYSDIAPFSWRLSNHIKEGRKHLNFSEWGSYSAKKKADRLEDMEDAFANGWMPLWDYKIMHPIANLTQAQRSDMAAWIKTLR